MGAAEFSGKLYIGATHRAGTGVFPDLPLAQRSSLLSVFPEVNLKVNQEAAKEGEIFSLEWITTANESSSAKQFVALRRYQTFPKSKSTDLLQVWLSEVQPTAKPELLRAMWSIFTEAKRLDAVQLVLRSALYDPSVADGLPPLRPTTLAVFQPYLDVRVAEQAELPISQMESLLGALQTALEPETLARAAAWARRVGYTLAGGSYVGNIAQLSVNNDGSLVVALYYMPVEPTYHDQRNLLHQPKGVILDAHGRARRLAYHRHHPHHPHTPHTLSLIHI